MLDQTFFLGLIPVYQYSYIKSSFHFPPPGAGVAPGPELPGAPGFPRGAAGEREVAAADVIQTHEPQLPQLLHHGAHTEADRQTHRELTKTFICL